MFSPYKVGRGHLAPFRIRDTEDGRILNLRVRQQDLFNLSGINVFAATDGHLLPPPAMFEPTRVRSVLLQMGVSPCRSGPAAHSKPPERPFQAVQELWKIEARGEYLDAIKIVKIVAKHPERAA